MTEIMQEQGPGLSESTSVVPKDTAASSKNVPVIHELRDAARHYRIITTDEEIVLQTGAQLVRACQLQMNVTAWAQNFTIACDHVSDWCMKRQTQVALALVELRSDKIVFYLVPISDQFDFKLSDEQADLDVFLNTRAAIGYAETRQIPGWEIDRFVPADSRRVWPRD